MNKHNLLSLRSLFPDSLLAMIAFPGHFFLGKVMVAVCFTALLSGCGFHLRGTELVGLDMGVVFIQSENPNGAFHQLLYRNIAASGFELAQSSGSVDYSLYLSDERNLRRPVATTADISVAEYQISQAVEIQLKAADGQVLIPEATLFTERTYTFDDSNLESSSEEEALLQREMRRDLVQQILRRMTATISRHRKNSGITR